MQLVQIIVLVASSCVLTTANPFIHFKPKNAAEPPFPTKSPAPPRPDFAIPHQWLNKHKGGAEADIDARLQKRADEAASTTTTAAADEATESVMIWTPTTTVHLAPEAPLNTSQADLWSQSDGPDCGVRANDDGSETNWGCNEGDCCSKFGYCGTDYWYCGFGCQHGNCERWGIK